jgi:Domain of unknown function (DUF4333)
MLRALLPVPALAAAALLVSGCGGLDTDKLETKIKEDAKKDGVTLTAVDCPSDVEAKKGKNFTCKATVQGGGSLTLAIEQTDDEGNVRYSVAK